MKIIQVGFGVFGRGWYAKIKRDHPDLEFVAVDTSPEVRARMQGLGETVYASFEEAMEAEKPDFVLNVTPPGAHDAVNEAAFNRGTPVLCEKPISDNYEKALELVQKAERQGIPFMIAEPYRRNGVFREMKRLLDGGRIGRITDVFIDLFIRYDKHKEYLVNLLADPVLQDLSIHHMDALRYLTGANGKSVFASSYNPPGSWFTGNARATAFFEMEGDIRARFNGSLVSSGMQTGYNGNWRIEGLRGVMTLTGDTLALDGADGQIMVEHPAEEEPDILSEFIAYLEGGPKPETLAADYIHSEALVHFALQSSGNRAMAAIV